MRLIDADELKENFAQKDMSRHGIWGTENILAIIDISPTIEEQPNKTLILDELWKIDGEPIFLVDTQCPDNTGWVIWDEQNRREWEEDIDDYGINWFAYRYVPKTAKGVNITWILSRNAQYAEPSQY